VTVIDNNLHHEVLIAKYLDIEKLVRNELNLVKNKLSLDTFPGCFGRLEGQCNDLREEILRFSESIRDLQTRESVLRVGIIGQVKAGKSSFINALLFDGQDILPKAATPMTAALTMVKHCDNGGEFSAKIEFYSREDWQLIQGEAQEYAQARNTMDKLEEQDIRKPKIIDKIRDRMNGNSDEIQHTRMVRERANAILEDPGKKASYELVTTANANKVNLDSCGEETRLISVSTLEELNKELFQYVGAEGKYTPLVKASTLYLSIDKMKGFELVDTPGINDPVVSRGERTLAYLTRCDVLFMLSYSGQFLDQSDLCLFSRTIPSQGIKQLVLIGSKIDTVFLQDKKAAEGGDIISAAKIVMNKLNVMANSILGSAAQVNPALKCILDTALPPKFISTILHDAALKMEREKYLNDNEKNILDRLCKVFPQSAYLLSDPKTLRGIAGVDRLGTTEFERLRDGKQDILKARYAGMAESKEPEFRGKVRLMREALETDLSILNSDSDDLLKELGKLKGKHDQLTHEVRVIFAEKGREVAKAIRNLWHMWCGMSRKAEVDEQIKQETYSVSTSKWYNIFSWGSHEVRYKDVRYVQPARIISDLNYSVESFSISATDSISDIFSEESLRDLGKKIMSKIMPIISDDEELVDASLYLSSIFLIICDTVYLPSIRVDISTMRSSIISKFNSETKDVDEFKAAFSDLKDECGKIIHEQLETQIENFHVILDNRANEFMKRVTDDIASQINILKRGAEERNELKHAYSELYSIIKNSVPV
jgi:hypothetical protein